MQRDPDVSNIRKNQQQVDIQGNTVGKNRPDVQYDKNEIHTNVEYDTQNVLPQNDPNARNKFFKVEHGK